MANAEQSRLWNEVNANRLFALRVPLAAAAAPYGLAALDALAPAPGERALDVGCGFGETTLELGRRVGPAGSALGVDFAERYLAVARREAAGAGNVRYLCADAQTHPFDAEFDACFSRFGVMFFDDPRAAFANLRRALAPGGRLAAVVWGPPEKCAWIQIPLRAVRVHLPGAGASAATGPGPFSLADEAALLRLLEGAGFGRAQVRGLDLPYFSGRALDEAASLLLQVGAAGAALREAGVAGERLRPRIERELREALSPWLGSGGVELPASALVVTAWT